MDTTVQLHDAHFESLLTARQIAEKVDELAQQIDQAYAGIPFQCIAVLNGAFVFAADLCRALKTPLKISFVKASSYKGTQSTGEVTELIGLVEDLSGVQVLIIEDIVDTGSTLLKIRNSILEKGAASVKIATCLFKPDNYTQNFPIDWVGFEIPDDFVVGYGMDYDGLGRGLEGIYKIQ